MADRLRAKVRLTYPGDASSLAIVQQAGGMSKLTDEQREQVRLKTVAGGDWCDDLPEVSRANEIRRGRVEVVPDVAPSASTPAPPAPPDPDEVADDA